MCLYCFSTIAYSLRILSEFILHFVTFFISSYFQLLRQTVQILGERHQGSEQADTREFADQ
jgi:hypothetical protein